MSSIELWAAPSDTEALSAAPPSVLGPAETMTLGEHGDETSVTGRNRFVFLVEQFYNPKIRAPMCLNAAAARSVLPEYFDRSRALLAGKPASERLERTKAEFQESASSCPKRVPCAT